MNFSTTPVLKHAGYFYLLQMQLRLFWIHLLDNRIDSCACIVLSKQRLDHTTMVHNIHTSILLATDTMSDNAKPISTKDRKLNDHELIDVSQRGANLPDAKTQQNKPNTKI